MIDEIKLTKDTERATHAQRLIDDAILNEAFAELERAYIERWRLSNLDDDKGREKLFLAINVVGRVKSHLNHIISDGKLASAELDHLARETGRKKRFGLV